MEEQRTRAKEAGKKGDVYANRTSFQQILDDHGPTEFVGREEMEAKATVLAVVPADDGTASVFLDRTPFYAESGGQVGDTGRITTDTGAAEVLDTTYGLPGPPPPPRAHHRGHASSPARRPRRPSTSSAATPSAATTPAPTSCTGRCARCWARTCKQQGSLVEPDRLRFDFGPADAAHRRRRSRRSRTSPTTRSSPTTPCATTRPPRRRRPTSAPSPSSATSTATSSACSRPGRHSIELCGGTHVRALGDIGPVKIVSEASIGANLRRIEAVTGTGPIERLREEERRLAELAEVLNVPVGRGRRRRPQAPRGDQGPARRGQGPQAPGRRRPGRVARRPRRSTAWSSSGSTASSGTPSATSRWPCATSAASGPSCSATAPEGGGAALVAAVTPDSGFDASALLEEAKKLIKGGGGKDPLLAVAGRQGRRRHRRGPRHRAGGGRHRRLVRALGIDLGTKRIGVALANSEGTLATPYEVVARSGDRARDHRAHRGAGGGGGRRVRSSSACRSRSTARSGAAAAAALAEADELAEATGLPVELWDERLTTVTADRDLMALDMKAGARRRVVDKVAASVMLQAWLDHRRLGAAAEDPAPMNDRDPYDWRRRRRRPPTRRRRATTSTSTTHVRRRRRLRRAAAGVVPRPAGPHRRAGRPPHRRSRRRRHRPLGPAADRPARASPASRGRSSIPEGSTSDDIGALLADEGVIASDFVWGWYLRINGGGPFQAGTYELADNSSIPDVIDVLEAGPAPDRGALVHHARGPHRARDARPPRRPGGRASASTWPPCSSSSTAARSAGRASPPTSPPARASSSRRPTGSPPTPTSRPCSQLHGRAARRHV